MFLIPAFLFAFSANIDCFIIGISYGLKGIRFRLTESILICLITLCGTAAALILGEQILSLCPSPYIRYAGNFILISLGIYYILKPLIVFLYGNTKQEPVFSKPSDNTARQLPLKTSLLLGISLSANNLGIGIGVSITGLNLFPTALLSFFVSVIFLCLGNAAGSIRFFRRAEKYSDLFSGILLILLGMYGLY